MNEEESKALSILAERSKISLDSNVSDKAAVTLKALLGAVPYVGSVLQEAVGIVIPNQRIERIVLTMECLAQKVNYIEEDVLQLKMLSEEFTDLLEDAIPQASRALSEERREYIASFLKNSITNEELDHVYEKKLLSILGELNDAEIIFLRYMSLRPLEKQEFMNQHPTVLKPIPTVINSPRIEHDKSALRSSFQDKLLEQGLVERRFVKTQSGKVPEMDEKTGTMKVHSYEITQLGRAFLRYIGQPATSDREYDEFLAQKQKNAES